MNIGDRVLGNWQNHGRWYLGSIQHLKPGLVTVAYDDGSVETLHLADVVLLITIPARQAIVGDRVLCQWRGHPTYHAGTVSEGAGEQVRIRYDDGALEWTSLELVRLPDSTAPVDHSASTPSTPDSKAEITIGARVMGRWQGGIKEYPGRVVRKNGNRLFVTYDDNDNEWTTADFVRVIAPDAAVPPAGFQFEVLQVPELDGQRLFPPITASFYDIGQTQEPGRKFLQLARQRLSWCQKVLGWGLDPAARIARLLYFHRLAFEAEVAGHPRRADFFFNQVQSCLPAVVGQPQVWETAQRLFFPDRSGELAVDLCTRVVREVLLATHCAFFNGRLLHKDDLKPEDRLFVHARHMWTLCEYAGLTKAEQFALLDPAAQAEIEILRRNKKWSAALDLVVKVRKTFPDRIVYQDLWAELTFSQLLEKMHQGANKHEQLIDAATLMSGIDQLEAERMQFPGNSVLYEFLGHLHHLRGIKLANAGSLSAAIVEVAKALAYCPDLNEARDTNQTLRRLMSELKIRVAQLEAQIRLHPYSILTEEGRNLQAEARSGSDPANAFEHSKAAKDLAEAYRVAQGRSLWRRVGLAEPANRWDARAGVLTQAMVAMLTAPPPDRQSLATHWRSVESAFPDLAGTQEVVCRFMGRRLFGVVPPEGIAALDVTATPAWSRGEPLTFWIFSRRDLGVKTLAGVAVLLVSFVIAGSIRDHNRLDERDAAYSGMLEAVAQGQDQAVLVAEKAFVDASPLFGVDKRLSQVLALGKDARQELVRRPSRDAAFARLQAAAQQRDDQAYITAFKEFVAAGPPDRKDERLDTAQRLLQQITHDPWKKRIERDIAYKAFLTALTKEDGKGLHNAAASFLEALPPGVEDKRASQVCAQRDRQQQDPWEKRKQRDAGYQQVIAAAIQQDLWQAGTMLAGGPFGPVGLPCSAADTLSQQLDQKILKGAQKFLDGKWSADDPREDQVRTLKAEIEKDPTHHRRTRDLAYDLLGKAVKAEDDEGVLIWSAAFLAAPPAQGNDPREQQVRILQQRFVGDPAIKRHARDQAYAKVTTAFKKGAHVDLLTAAESFLGARPQSHKDDREEQVLQLYQEAFVRWFVTLTKADLDTKDVRERLTRYRQLIPEPKQAGETAP